MFALTATPDLAANLAPIASLAMYDPPPLRYANDTLWEAIAERLQLQGFDAPTRLTRDVDLAFHRSAIVVNARPRCVRSAARFRFASPPSRGVIRGEFSASSEAYTGSPQPTCSDLLLAC
ncbi:hypothetical protein [Phenylobacterium sp.]|uniref:hypothetical protein n=1 Tax=Phenylobacterium sp. TaxID=1871053 RepID=UPI002EDB4A7D